MQVVDSFAPAKCNDGGSGLVAEIGEYITRAIVNDVLAAECANRETAARIVEQSGKRAVARIIERIATLNPPGSSHLTIVQ